MLPTEWDARNSSRLSIPHGALVKIIITEFRQNVHIFSALFAHFDQKIIQDVDLGIQARSAIDF